MSTTLDDARKVESQFLSAIERRFDAAKEWMAGSSYRRRGGDQRDRLREQMRARRMTDLDLLDRLPNNRRIEQIGYVRPWYWFRRRKVSALTAGVVTPLDDALRLGEMGASGGEGLRPVARHELAEYVDGLLAGKIRQRVIGICSPSGFTDEARRSGLTRSGLTLVLIEPGPGGGWRITGVSGEKLEQACKLFDPEGQREKQERVRQALEARRGSLMTDGISAAELAETLGVETRVVEEAFKTMASENAHLNVTRGSRASILYYTSTVVKEARPMSVMDFLKRILGRDALPAEKIRELSGKQAEIDEQRRDIEKALTELVDQEKAMLDEGAQATSPTVKRRLASQLAQLRQKIGLQNEKVSILNKQSQVLGRHIHNLELAQTAKPEGLPGSEDITEAAAAAEAAIEELDEAYETVRTVGSATGESAITEEEQAILAEFEAQASRKTDETATQASKRSEADASDEATPHRAPEERRREADA